MRVGSKNKSSGDVGVLEPGTGITAENYPVRAKAYASLAGSGFVIRALEGESGSLRTGEPATEAEWLAWIGYFANKGIKSSFLAVHGVGTVPAQWPEAFDAEARQSDHFAALPKRLSYSERLSMRARVGDLFRPFLASLPRNADNRRGPLARLTDARDEFGARASAEDRLQSLAERYAGDPTKLSGEAQRIIGEAQEVEF